MPTLEPLGPAERLAHKPHKLARYVMARGHATLGRDSSCDIKFSVPEDAPAGERADLERLLKLVPIKSVRVVREEGIYYLEPMGPVSGVYLNGEPLTQREGLFDLDEICFGDPEGEEAVRLYFRATG